MGFETYVIRVLQHYLRAQKKRLTTGDSSCLFDAILPDGMDDIKGPLYLEVKSGYASKAGYFRSVQQFALHARGSEPGVRPGQRPGYGGAARGRRCRRRFGPFCAHKKADGAPFSL